MFTANFKISVSNGTESSDGRLSPHPPIFSGSHTGSHTSEMSNRVQDDRDREISKLRQENSRLKTELSFYQEHDRNASVFRASMTERELPSFVHSFDSCDDEMDIRFHSGEHTFVF